MMTYLWYAQMFVVSIMAFSTIAFYLYRRAEQQITWLPYHILCLALSYVIAIYLLCDVLIHGQRSVQSSWGWSVLGCFVLGDVGLGLLLRSKLYG